MACVSKRRGKWVVDYRDGAGIRRWITCATRREADAIHAEKVREARQPTRPVVDSNITVASYSERWLSQTTATVKAKTLEGYAKTLRLHILPTLGSRSRRAFLTALHAAQLRFVAAPARRESRPRSEATRSCLDPAHGWQIRGSGFRWATRWQ